MWPKEEGMRGEKGGGREGRGGGACGAEERGSRLSQTVSQSGEVVLC